MIIWMKLLAFSFSELVLENTETDEYCAIFVISSIY